MESKCSDVGLKRGTRIFSENPFAYTLKSKYRKDRCDFCLKSNKVLKCSDCHYVYYCGRVCQTQGWLIHKSECWYLKKIVSKIVPDAVRLILRVILKLKNNGDNEKSYYNKQCYRRFKDLMSHYKELKHDEKRIEHFKSVVGVLSDILGHNELPNEYELLGIYGRVIINSFNILDYEMNSVGTGIYLAVSIINHSCLPNAVATFEGTKINIHIIEDIPILDWSKIFISYIDLLNTPEDRRNELKENYYFLCTCSKCIDFEENLTMSAASCESKECKELIDINKDNCPKCGVSISNEFKSLFKEVIAFTKLNLNNMKEIVFLDLCKASLKRQENILHEFNIWHVKTLDAAFESAINVNKWEEALEFGNKLIPVYKKYYGDWNPLLGLLYLKIGKIQLYNEMLEEALKNLYEASKVIEVTHGKTHTLYTEEIIPFIHQAITEHSRV